ncbi:MAG: hypothetical protein L3J67_11440 [Hyphomicrobiaceae bacterium]|nr:hypothetical protein [Hyphomicrobiaceae bacterium]
MRAVLAGIFGLALVMASAPANARSASIIGNWSGGGSLSTFSGTRERTKCRATIRPKKGKRYFISANCAVASLGLIHQDGILKKVGKNRYRGRFRNAQYDISGSITILLRGNRQYISLKSSGGRGRLVLTRRR